MSITVYTSPSCVQCEQTKKVLTRGGIEFTTVDLSEDSAALEMVKELGYASAPVVIAGENHWAGFRPDLLAQLTA